MPAAKFVARLHPYVRGLSTLYDLYQLWQALRDRQQRIPNGWRAVLNCSPPGAPYGHDIYSQTSCWQTGIFIGETNKPNSPRTMTAASFWEVNALVPHPTAPGAWYGQMLGRTRYTRINPGSVPLPQPTWVPNIGWQINPNIIRQLPGEFIQPDRRPPTRRQREHQRERRRERQRERERQRQRAIAPHQLALLIEQLAREELRFRMRLSTQPFTWGSTRTPPRTHRRTRTRARERKAFSRIRQIGVMLSKALDKVSESAEVVDAIYDSLPDDVKKRWGKDRKSRPFADSAGQYGIDGADWKLQALYHNWHRIDIDVAVTNIVKNEISDSIIGRLKQIAPKNIGMASNEADKALSKLIDTTLDRVIDEMEKWHERDRFQRELAKTAR